MSGEILQHHRDSLGHGIGGIVEIVGPTRFRIDSALGLSRYRANAGGVQLSLRDFSIAVGVARANVVL